MPRSGRILITGAAGYIGRSLARRLVAVGDQDLLLWLHAGDSADARRQVEALRAKLGAAARRVEFAAGDLAEEDPFGSIDPGSIETIVHAAAVTRFNVERQTAATVNLAGTERLLAFASRCPRLESVNLLSSIYAAGLAQGRIAEAPLVRPRGFANHYEWSKWAAEEALLKRHGQLPWRILRLATALADDDWGRVGQINAVHNTLRLLFRGLLGLVPGDAGTPVYFMTANFAVESILAVLARAPIREVYHLCHRAAESLTLGDFAEVAHERFLRDPGFRERGLLPPLLCDEAAFGLLDEGIESFAGRLMAEVTGSIRPFAAQLFRAKAFDNGRLMSLLPDRPAPDARGLVAATCDFLIQNNWRPCP